MDKASKIAEARKLRKFIEENAELLTDDAALEMPNAFPMWTEDGEYEAGDRVRFNDTLYKCLQSHTAQVDWTPVAAVSLWAEVLPGQEGTEIGEWVQPDSTNPYMTGDRVTHNGLVWECEIDNNVWEPGVYGWKQV